MALFVQNAHVLRRPDTRNGLIAVKKRICYIFDSRWSAVAGNGGANKGERK